MDGHVLRTLLDTVEIQASQIETLERRLRVLQGEAGGAPRVVEVRPDELAHPPDYATLAPVADSGRDLACWPRYDSALEALEPNAGWINFGLKDRGVPVVGFAVCGLDTAGLAAVVATVERTQRTQRNFAPLFLTDSMSFEVFRRHGYAFEYIPSPASWTRVEGTEPWEGRIIRRLSAIKAKWGLTRIVQMGPHALPGAADAPPPQLEDRR